MPDMDRERTPFGPADFGIVSTQEVDVETFLNSEPEDIQFIKPALKGKVQGNTEEEDTKDPKKKEKKKVEEEEEETPSKELTSDDVFSAMEKKLKKEETDEEEQSTEDDSKKEEEEEEEGDGNIYTSVAKELFSNGIFTIDEDEDESEFDEITTPEQLLERFQFQSRKNLADTVEKFLGRYGDDYRDMFENVFIRGVKPEEYLSRYTRIQGVKDIDITDESNQERLVRDLYRSEGKSSEYIEKKLTQLKNYNDLHEEAVEAQRVLIQKEELAIQQESQKREADIVKKQQIRNEYVGNIGRILSERLKQKEFDSIPIDRKMAEQTMAYLTQERFQTTDKKLLTTFDKDLMDLDRPENHELKVKVALLLQMLKEDPKLTKLASRAVSNESNELFKGLKQKAVKSGQVSKDNPKKEEKLSSWFK
jgi:hypothetical protein